jgi:hypothetical protein
MLSDDHRKKKKKLGVLHWHFGGRYHRDGCKFLDHIVTRWNLGSPFHPWGQASVAIEWDHPRSPSKLRKLKQTLCTRKIMATVLWNRKGVLVEFMPQGTTINAESYRATLRRLLRARMLLPTRKQCCKRAGKFMSIVAYSPDMAPSDFSLVPQHWRNSWMTDASKAMKKWRMPSRSG